MGVSREDVTFEDHVSRGGQWGLRLWSEVGGKAVAPPWRTSAASLSPLWSLAAPPFWYGHSAPVGGYLSPLHLRLWAGSGLSDSWGSRSGRH